LVVNLTVVLADSPEERAVVLKALRQCENLFSRYYLNESLEDVSFNFQLLDDVIIGSPFRCVNFASAD
jgi:transglutaminase 1